jgi:transcriptional regulator with XRE-family HTH domain
MNAWPILSYTRRMPDEQVAAHEQLAADGRRLAPAVGETLRERRMSMGLSLRELARRLSLSASMVSQIERCRTTPSVGTLYAMASELGLSMGALFPESSNGDETGRSFRSALNEIQVHGTALESAPDERDPVVRPEERKRIQLDSGVHWERLTRTSDPNVDFLYVEYGPGGESCDANALVRHSGREYGHVLSGKLEVTLGFDAHVLGPGHSISFDSTVPHRLATVGREPVCALWFVVGRLRDPRSRG